MISFRADNYAVAKKMLVNKYCTKASSLAETQSIHCQRIMAVIKWRFKCIFSNQDKVP